MKVKKAVIPAAGLGTRFLPATKTVPKELLPIVDVPSLFYVVEDAVHAGIEDIVIVAGRGKTAIEDFFDTSYELQDLLVKTGKEAMAKRLDQIQNMANIISIRQKQAKGLGHAVYAARPAVGNEPFAVLLGDEVMLPTKEGAPSVTKQLSDIFAQKGESTVAVMKVHEDDVSKYGIVAIENEQSPMKVTEVIEKPSRGSAPSQWALPGRYVFTSRLFALLKDLPPGKNGEIQLTDAMTAIARSEGLWATPFVARRYDAGDKFGYLQANIEQGLLHPEIGPRLKEYLKILSQSL